MASQDDYRAYIERRSQLGNEYGFAATIIPPQAYDFQASLIEWAVRQGRAGRLLDGREWNGLPKL